MKNVRDSKAWDGMRIVFLYREKSVSMLVCAALDMEGYGPILVTSDPAEARRLIEESEDPCLLLADNLRAIPEGYGALSWLRADPQLRARVRVIGVDASSSRQPELAAGILDDWIRMPFTFEVLLEQIAANTRALTEPGA